MKRFWDPFKGNIRNPGEFVFIYILIDAIVIACLIMVINAGAPVVADDLQHASVTFETFMPSAEDSSDLWLSVSGESMNYMLRSYESTLAFSEVFVEKCQNGELFQIGYTTVQKADPPFHILYEIVDRNDTAYLTLERMNEYYNTGVVGLYGLFGGLALAWNVYIVLSIIVGRHPERFPRGFIGLFFKSGSLKSSKRHSRRR